MIKICLVGYGYWGPNLLRNFNSIANCKVSVVCDTRRERLELVHKSYPDTVLTTTLDEAFHNDIDAVVIATPVFTHFEIAKKTLLANKHVLIEKPMASSLYQCEELISLAEKKGLTLMVDHTFLYTGAVRKIKELLSTDFVGKIQYIDSTRINLGLFQPDINVLWDLAPHDISIVNYIIHAKPLAVNATGISHTNNDIENIAYLNIFFENNIIAHYHCSWSSPVKIRKFLIGGDKKMIVWDDMEPTEKVKVYDSGYVHKTDEDKRRIMVDYRTGDIYVPKVSSTEALSLMAKDFLKATTDKIKPESNAENGLLVVKILEAADKSIKNKGKEILL
jgi:predicted dehydrogenase